MRSSSLASKPEAPIVQVPQLRQLLVINSAPATVIAVPTVCVGGTRWERAATLEDDPWRAAVSFSLIMDTKALPEEQTMNRPRPLLHPVTLALGLALAGWFVGHGFVKGRSADRYVTVKGVSERETKADLALWPLSLNVTDNDLSQAQATLRRNTEQVFAFLVRHGIDTANAELQGYRVTDLLARPYGGDPSFRSRFIITQTVMVRSDDPDRILAASQAVGELVDAGVVLSSGEEWGPGGPTFLFTRLNDLKPEMIAEATANAREAAEQFALDSRSSLGGIRQANQGVFVILPRDQAAGIQEQNQLFKLVRVVSTVEYFLKN